MGQRDYSDAHTSRWHRRRQGDHRGVQTWIPLASGALWKTGVAGLTVGGGAGWLVRKYGLTCNNVLSCEVVTAEGAIVAADAETNADLFWGLRGGGGNFGIVTSFLFQAHPVSTVLGGVIVHPRRPAIAVI